LNSSIASQPSWNVNGPGYLRPLPYKGTAPGVQGLFPTYQAYNLIFITAALALLASVAMAFSVISARNRTSTITSEQHEPNK
jgi:hypothetical protein